MADTRHKDVNWNLGPRDDNGRATWDQIRVALMMDIRDELQDLNRLLRCHNFTTFPEVLCQIRSNTAKPRAKKAKP